MLPRKEFEKMAWADLWRGYGDGTDASLLRTLLEVGPYRAAISAFRNRKWLKDRADSREAEYNRLERELHN